MKSAKKIFQVTEKLLEDQREIGKLTTIDYEEPTWSARSLLCDKAFRITNAKTFVFADSVPCSGSMKADPIEAWKNKIEWYLENHSLKDLNRIDGEPMELEWKIFPTLGILEEIQKIMTELQCEPEQFTDRIILMYMHNDIVWTEQGNTEKCEKKQEQLRIMLADSRAVVGHSWDLDQKRLENAELRATGRLVAKARPRLKAAVRLSSTCVTLREREWIDVNPERFRQDCFVVSKAMIRLLRHDQSVPREDDGAVRLDGIMEEFKMVLCSGQLTIGCLFWQEEEDQRKGFNIV